jgi:hypothetical protein
MSNLRASANIFWLSAAIWEGFFLFSKTFTQPTLPKMSHAKNPSHTSSDVP